VSATAWRDTAMKYATYKASTVIISRFVDNDLGHDGEASNHKKDEWMNDMILTAVYVAYFTMKSAKLKR
jgi:hypothetical protein